MSDEAFKAADALGETIYNLVQDYVDADGLSEEQQDLRLQAALSVLASVLGHLDGTLCLHGFHHEDRAEALTTSLREGKMQALSEHDERCEGCESSQALREEVFPN